MYDLYKLCTRRAIVIGDRVPSSLREPSNWPRVIHTAAASTSRLDTSLNDKLQVVSVRVAQV